MARPIRNNNFPKWKPRKILWDILTDSKDRKYALKRFRSSCSAFISNKVVRALILEKCDHKCVECGSKDKLQIDHIKSVLYCFKNRLFEFCNTEENLQVLCQTCNAKKQP